ncbi:MAG: hypothetical protein ACN6PJ_15950 [Achromobacter sp.]|uniref:hypothetical protein n=1 Tax=Achromobacter sp. TaxID=134375 RepID=UPI003D00D963
MQKQIESAILSNVGNRLTQELAYGLIMTITHLAQQAVDAAQQAALAGPDAGQVGDAQPVPDPPTPPQGGGFQDFVDPAYARAGSTGGPAAPKPKPKRPARKAAVSSKARK